MQKGKLKTQKGITLIALIITIIVMLILVGVSVTVALNGGIFNKAKEAAEGTQSESEKEQLLEIAMGLLGPEGTLTYSDLDEELEGSKFTPVEGKEGVYTGPLGKQYSVSEYGIVSDFVPTWSWEDDGDGIIETGEIVTHSSGEQFYVISSDNSVNVTLLAKMNIDTTTLEQSSSANAIAFSSTDYWSSSFTASPYDLTESEGETPDPGHFAALAAYNYGERLGATGRLMTMTEADGLTSYSDILYGPSGAKLFYYLGSAQDAHNVWSVQNGSYFNLPYSYPMGGVRPVIEISESSIS